MKRVGKYLFLALIILLFQIIAPLNLDEIWNYGFVHNLVTGLEPYKDFNMVIPPFSLFLFYLPLKNASYKYRIDFIYFLSSRKRRK